MNFAVHLMQDSYVPLHWLTAVNNWDLEEKVDEYLRLNTTEWSVNVTLIDGRVIRIDKQYLDAIKSTVIEFIRVEPDIDLGQYELVHLLTHEVLLYGLIITITALITYYFIKKKRFSKF